MWGRVPMNSVDYRARLFLNGHPRLELHCGTRVPIQSRKGIALLALLATSDRGERSRVWLQHMLWGSRPQIQAQSSLRRELANLKKVLEAAGIDILRSEHRVVRLLTEKVWIDIAQPGPRPGNTADFLEGIDIAGEEAFEDWLREMRNRPEDEYQEEATLTPPRLIVPGGLPELQAAIIALQTNPANASSRAGQLASQSSQLLVDRLARVRWLPVIPANIADDHPRALAELSQALGARYILKSEVNASERGFTIGFTMLEMPGQIIRWTEVRELPPNTDHRTLAREIERAVNCAAETFNLSEQRHVPPATTAKLPLAALLWKIRFHISQLTDADLTIAGSLIEAELARYPTHSELLMLRANHALWRHWLNRSSSTASMEVAPLIHAAIRSDPADARGPLYCGILETWHRRSGSAIRQLSQACTLDPSSAQAHAHLGAAHYLAGRPDRALKPLEHALFLAPLDPKRFLTLGQMAVVLWMLGRYEEALDKAHEIHGMRPGYSLAHVVETACLVELGRIDEARARRDRVQAGNPTLYRDAMEWMPFADRTWHERLRNVIELPLPQSPAERHAFGEV